MARGVADRRGHDEIVVLSGERFRAVILVVAERQHLAEKLAVGTGTAEPWGIFITTTTTVDVTTDNTFGAADIDKVWAALGETFRSRATWFMNVDVENDIRGFGSGTATSRFTVDQTREGISLLNGRPVVLSDWAPTWTGTDAASILVLGDFSKFKVVQRAGMTGLDEGDRVAFDIEVDDRGKFAAVNIQPHQD